MKNQNVTIVNNILKDNGGKVDDHLKVIRVVKEPFYAISYNGQETVRHADQIVNYYEKLPEETIDMENATLIGRWINELNSCCGEDAFEELYLTDNGEFFLHGNKGVQDLKRDLFSASWGKSSEPTDETIPLSSIEARIWAARYLPMENFAPFFGNITEFEKIMSALSYRDLYMLIMDASDARSSNYSAEGYASDAAISLTDSFGYGGLDVQAVYEWCKRLWHLWDAPTDCN